MRFDSLRPALITLAGLVLLTQFGCAFGEFRPDDPFKRQYDLEMAQERYSDLVRWAKYDEASHFIAPEARRAFRESMPDFEEIRFTEHETHAWELDEEKRNAVIEVTYTGYTMAVPFEFEVHETQTWTRTGKSNNWMVVSVFEGLDEIASN